MSATQPGRNGKVIHLRPKDGQLYRIRITISPNDSMSIGLVEDLLGRSELSRCEHAGEDGTTTWSLIGNQGHVDRALDGIAVVIPVDEEFFETDEGRLFFVTTTKWFLLQGIAEEAARCWCDDSLDDFESEVHEDVRCRIKAEIDTLPWPGDSTGDEIIGRVEDTVLEQVNYNTVTEEEIHDAVWEIYWKLVKGGMGKEEKS